MQFKDYYRILGVSREASADTIKAAYRRLARKYHPDVSRETDAESRFKEINEAYEALKDPEKRAVYDRIATGHHAGEPFRAPPGWDSGPGSAHASNGFSDFFDALFRGSRQRGGVKGQRGGDQVAAVTLTLEEAFRGGSRQVSITGPRGLRTLNVQIPPGVTPGQRIRLAGQGEVGLSGGPAGDLYLTVEIAHHRWFRLDGRDVYLDIPLAPWEAALGTMITVPTLGGPVQVSITPGSQNGQRLRLKGRGFSGTPTGDQYLTLKIHIPPLYSEREKALYEELARAATVDIRKDWPV
ncbi:DnaJ C-terminal domain-containing protein [Candidatus Macondimonas diazotrophica]|jgi:curved DNA-binding protein|uniref:J domain-containing protein n=1 Tax=Candidatus Macondimonas diazotrophica TaxID=2305248 RepID=A0A4Z0F8U2_9GAMM|nr:DnaJ C-terminal domain-containing protein [Candidatus Macondimonas diazotrophica]TFZ82207.1 J domain-containing protein [Candidatus Macondimonas diazotrophica]